LGVVLYELLCGRKPFEGPPEIVLVNTKHTPPPPPRSVNPSVPEDLEKICLKTMAKRPEDRYASCQELADELAVQPIITPPSSMDVELFNFSSPRLSLATATNDISKDWYCYLDYKRQGPMSLQELRKLIATGKLSSADEVRRGEDRWVPVFSVKELSRDQSKDRFAWTRSRKNLGMIITSSVATLFLITTVVLAMQLSNKGEAPVSPPIGPNPPKKDSEPPRLHLKLSPPELILKAGETATIQVFVTRNGRRGPVHVEIQSLPAKITAKIPVIGENQNEGQIELTADKEIQATQKVIKVEGTMGKLDDVARVLVTVEQSRSPKEPAKTASAEKSYEFREVPGVWYGRINTDRPRVFRFKASSGETWTQDPFEPKWVKLNEPDSLPKGNYEMIVVTDKVKDVTRSEVYRFDALSGTTWRFIQGVDAGKRSWSWVKIEEPK
jgi:hypothetical protein